MPKENYICRISGGIPWKQDLFLVLQATQITSTSPMIIVFLHLPERELNQSPYKSLSTPITLQIYFGGSHRKNKYFGTITKLT
jgi:hypothetical protein